MVNIDTGQIIRNERVG